VPVKCPACGTIWDHDLGATVTAETVTIAAGAISPRCPSCHRQFINNASARGLVTPHGLDALVRALQPVGAARFEYEQLQQLLEQAFRQGATTAQVAELITNQTPRFKDLADWLLAHKDTIIGVVGILFAIYAWTNPRDAVGQPAVVHEKVIEKQSPSTEEIRRELERIINQLGCASIAGDESHR
jgi:hypothetical protein